MDGDRGSIGQWWRNSFPPRRPFARWVATFVRNEWRRVALRQLCCGHDGEPGC